MPKKTKELVCNGCGLSEPMYIQLNNGGKLPSYATVPEDGIYCYPCYRKERD